MSEQNAMYGVFINRVKFRTIEGEPVSTPKYATPGSAGMDIEWYDKDHEKVILTPGERLILRTGLYTEFGPEYELQVRSRSGLAAKHGIIVLNAPGTIDSDYRDELKIILFNTSNSPYTISRYDRIAQLVLAPVVRAHESVLNQHRVGGLGSTGVN